MLNAGMMFSQSSSYYRHLQMDLLLLATTSGIAPKLCTQVNILALTLCTYCHCAAAVVLIC